MEKALLLSVLVSMVVLPIRAARLTDARRGLRGLVLQLLAANLVYWVAVVFVWFTYLHGGSASSLLHPVGQ